MELPPLQSNLPSTEYSLPGPAKTDIGENSHKIVLPSFRTAFSSFIEQRNQFNDEESSAYTPSEADLPELTFSSSDPPSSSSGSLSDHPFYTLHTIVTPDTDSQDPEEGYSFKDVRSTYFQISEERGRWRTDPKPLVWRCPPAHMVYPTPPLESPEEKQQSSSSACDDKQSSPYSDDYDSSERASSPLPSSSPPTSPVMSIVVDDYDMEDFTLDVLDGDLSAKETSETTQTESLSSSTEVGKVPSQSGSCQSETETLSSSSLSESVPDVPLHLLSAPSDCEGTSDNSLHLHLDFASHEATLHPSEDSHSSCASDPELDLVGLVEIDECRDVTADLPLSPASPTGSTSAVPEVPTPQQVANDMDIDSLSVLSDFEDDEEPAPPVQSSSGGPLVIIQSPNEKQTNKRKASSDVPVSKKQKLDNNTASSSKSVSAKSKKAKKSSGPAKPKRKSKTKDEQSEEPAPKDKKREREKSKSAEPISPSLQSELQGMLIETLAASRASSLPGSVLCKSVISARPALKDQMDESEWLGVMVQVLEDGAACHKGKGVFGKVESSGKDRLDRPLEAKWFYNPDCDPDQERATLVKSMMPRAGKRSETMKYKQYYWRPLEKVCRWDAEDDL